MSGEQYADLAVTALVDKLTANFSAQLRAVEAGLGLDDGALGDPVDIVAADIERDNRVPLIGVWDDGLDPINQRAGLWSVDCTIGMTQVGDADVDANAARLRRWVSALINMIRADPSLGNRVISAIIKPGSVAGSFGDQSATRLAYLFPVEVRVSAP